MSHSPTIARYRALAAWDARPGSGRYLCDSLQEPPPTQLQCPALAPVPGGSAVQSFLGGRIFIVFEGPGLQLSTCRSNLYDFLERKLLALAGLAV